MIRISKLLFLLLLLTVSMVKPSWGQFYYNGRGPMNIKWYQTKSPNYRLIYPDYFAPVGRGLAAFLDSIGPGISYGFQIKPQRLPIVLHTESLLSNGEVVWAPKRSELVTTPPAGGIHADLWLKQLAIHEARHVAQLSALRSGMTKWLSVLFGQAGTSISMLCVPQWYMEGDAVLAETQFSEFGRGLQPEFTVRMRAFLAADSSRIRLSKDHWSCGSYNMDIPGVYEFGYQMVAAGERHLGPGVWEKAVEYAGRYPIKVVPMRIYLRKYHNYHINDLLEVSLRELYHFWEPHSAVPDSYNLLTRPERFHTTYADPVLFRPYQGSPQFIATKSDFEKPHRLVIQDIKGSEQERLLTRIAPPSSRPILDEKSNRLYWTEYKPHPIWEYKNRSIIRSFDLNTGKKGKTYGRGKSNYFITPITVAENGKESKYFASVTPNLLSGTDLVLWNEEFNEIDRLRFKYKLTSVHGLAWNQQTASLIFIALDEQGMWLGKTGVEDGRFNPGYAHLTEPSMVTVSGLRSGENGKIYFSSIQSGKDEIHEYDLETGIERRVTTSRFGAYTPAPGSTEDELLLISYTSDGTMVAQADIRPDIPENPNDTITRSRLPNNILNIPSPKWDVPNMSDFSLAELEADSSLQKRRKTKHYNKNLRWFNVHTWVPGLGINVEKAIDERSLRPAIGASMFFQSVMGDSYGGVSYGYLHSEHSVNGSWTYAGLPVKFTLSTEYGGGKQLVYRGGATLFVPNPKNYWQSSIEAFLPINLSGGSNTRLLQPSFRVTHYNALLFDRDKLTLTEGFHKYEGVLWWSSNRRTGIRSVLPRLGYALRANFIGTFDSKFGHGYGLYARGYLPGFAQTHTLTLRAGGMYQKEGRWNFNQKPLFPRGCDNRWSAERFGAISADYTFPVWYPDGGINSLIYFKRIWMSVFGDYGKGDYFTSTRGRTVPLKYHSYGSEIGIEFNLMGSHFPITTKLTLANPSDDSFYLGAGISVAF